MANSNEIEVICPFCHRPAVWCENKEVYGRNFGKSYMIWLCKPCDAYVGCHQNTKKPLGTMANAHTREMRRRVHAVIDPIWKSGKISRKKLYRLISIYTAKQYHTAECTVQDCEAILNINFNSLLESNLNGLL